MITLTLTPKQFRILESALASNICESGQVLKFYMEDEPRYPRQLQYVTELKTLRTLMTNTKKELKS